MLTQPTQEALFVQRAILGDPDSFAWLYTTYVDPIYRFVFFRTNNREVAQDLTAQTFLRAWEKVRHYEHRGLPFGAWLFHIARNLVLDYYRACRKTIPLEVHVEHPSPGASNIDDEVEQHLQLEQLSSAWHYLTKSQQQVLRLRFFSGLSTKEVAQIMGKPCGAIRALQMRGLQSLQRSCQE